jgi:hypothetical protein
VDIHGEEGEEVVMIEGKPEEGKPAEGIRLLQDSPLSQSGPYQLLSLRSFNGCIGVHRKGNRPPIVTRPIVKRRRSGGL